MNADKCDFEPFFRANSRVLLVGLFPNEASKKGEFYYNHSKNRFWEIMQSVFEMDNLCDNAEAQRRFLEDKCIAICDIIKIPNEKKENMIPNDFYEILQKTQIKKIFVIGGEASDLVKHFYPCLNFQTLISSSNTTQQQGYDTPKLIEQYKAIKKALEA